MALNVGHDGLCLKFLKNFKSEVFLGYTDFMSKYKHIYKLKHKLLLRTRKKKSDDTSSELKTNHTRLWRLENY